MCWQPVKEIASLRTKTHSLAKQTIAPGHNPLADIASELIDLHAEISPENATEIVFKIHGREVVYDVKKQEIICGSKRVPLPLIDGRVRLEIIADRLSLEIFGNNGLVYMPMSITPKPRDNSGSAALGLSVSGGNATIHSTELHELRSIWK
jgi:sucrose-6-phosphate hydrolase SacC (GH32 family)